MEKDGRMIDVLVEENIGRDPATGMPKYFGLIVWADSGMKDVIKNIPGVHYVSDYSTCYHVGLDPRYNKEFLKAEIEAQIKINANAIQNCI
jgi:hypothetical protein